MGLRSNRMILLRAVWKASKQLEIETGIRLIFQSRNLCVIYRFRKKKAPIIQSLNIMQALRTNKECRRTKGVQWMG